MNILATTDGSPRSIQVLAHAAALQRATGGEFILLRVINPLTDLGKVFAPSVEAAVTELRETWRSGLQHVLTDVGLSNARVEVVALEHKERAHHAIARVARASGTEVIAMDSRGAGAVRHAIVGSVAMSVVGEWDGPTFLTGPKVEAPKQGSEPYHIMITDDGSPASESMFAAMAPLLDGTNVQCTLLNVYSPVASDRGEQVERTAAMERLKELRKLLPASIRVEVTVRVVSVAGGIDTAVIAAAQEFGADAIAMATHGHSARYHLFAGSTAMGVVGRSPVPVFLKRPD